MLLEELEQPKSQQRLTEDLFIEMEKALKTVTKRLPAYRDKIDTVRDVLVEKVRDKTIGNVTDFRQLSKIATAMDTLGVTESAARKSLDRVFDPTDQFGIREAYERTVEFQYDEHKALRSVRSLTDFVGHIVDSGQEDSLREDFVVEVRVLFDRLKELFAESE